MTDVIQKTLTLKLVSMKINKSFYRLPFLKIKVLFVNMVATALDHNL